MGIVIGAVVVVFVLALIIFPGVRGKLKVLVGGFLNIFVEDIAKTPEGAKAVFQQAIEEVQERYNKAGDTLNRFVGEQSSVQKNLNKLYGELKDVESKCESLVRSGNMADAAIFSTRREEILFEISQKEGYLREIEPMVKEAQTVYEAYDKKLRELKKQSRMTVEEMKLRGNMKDLLGDLDELRRDSATDKLLGSVRDGAEDLRKEVDGAIVVHASRTTTKMSMAEKNAAKAQSDAYLQSLATIQSERGKEVTYHEENETHYRWPCGDLRHRAGVPRWYRRLRLQLLQEQHRRRQTHQFGYPVWQHVPEVHDKALRRQDGHL